MKYYSVTGVVDNKQFEIKKRFKTRDKAIHYMFDNKLPYSSQLLYEIEKEKHIIEYVCNNHNRFFVSRCVE